MTVLLGTVAQNKHVQNIALALHEAGVLGAFITGGVDNYRTRWSREARRLVGDLVPRLDKQLLRRRVRLVPDEFVYSHWRWDLPRTLATRLGPDSGIADWLWEREEHRLDQKCARLIAQDSYDVFFGVEHGSLDAIRASRRAGKRSVVAFLSPQHLFRESWLDREYERFPELLTAAKKRILRRSPWRDKRRDAEAREADFIHANSELTARSLVQAGADPRKIIRVPLGSPATIPESQLDTKVKARFRIAYAGPIAVHKGAHYLLQAWKALGQHGGAELHFYGQQQLPKSMLAWCGSDVVFHGSVPQAELFDGYDEASVLAFPTLCDGFGAVVMEAFAHGLPVLTTRNAGAADFIEEGRNGFIVPPADVEALASRLDWCLAHPRDLADMRAPALATAQGWTWEDFRKSFRAQWLSLLGLDELALAEPRSWQPAGTDRTAMPGAPSA